MKVAAIHFGKTPDLDQNEDELIKLNIEAAREHDADLIVNPEQSILPLSSTSARILVNSKADDVAASREGAIRLATERYPRFVERVVAEVAARYGCYVVVSVIRADPEYHILYSSALVLGPKTEQFSSGVYHTYDKRELHGDIYAVKGSSPLVPVDLEIGKIGVLICADYSVPLITRSLVLNGGELIAIPAALTGSTLDTLKARAIENRIPLVLSNCFHSDFADEIQYPPESAIVSGDEVRSTNKRENKILTCEIDTDDQKVKDQRKKRLERRRPELYAGAMVDLTSPVLRSECPPVEESEVSVVTISGKAALDKSKFDEALARIRLLAETCKSVIVVLPEFPLNRSALNEQLERLKQCNVYTACGFIDGANVMNCLSAPDGQELMPYRKVHLSDMDIAKGIQAGNRLEFYLDLPMGRVALLSGEDLLYPEAVETLRNCAVDLILAPANMNSDSDIQVLCKDIAQSRHISLAIADYESKGGIYERSPNWRIADDELINSLKLNTQEGKIQPAKGLPAVPLGGGETLIRK